MSRHWWKWFLGFGVTCMAVALLALSDEVCAVAYLAVAGSSVVLAFAGIRTNRPPDRLPWYLLVAGITLFLEVVPGVVELEWRSSLSNRP